MKKLIYFLVIILFVFNCDRTSDEILETTFLEKHEGTVWLKNNPEQILLIRFINNTDAPLEYWINEETCYSYYLERIYEGNSLTINSEDILEFSYYRCIDATDCVNIITLNILDKMMLLESKHYEDEILISSEYIGYSKSNENVDSFNLCKN